MVSCWLDNKKGEITMSTPNENPNVSETPIFHPFPEPSTMPSGWDLSGLTPDPAPAPTAPADDAPEA
jgi:hypothetical protein